MTFTAIDFETATGHFHSACAVGIVTVENGIITEEYYTLIQPPNNEYSYHNIMVHGIKPIQTLQEKTFDDLFPEIKKAVVRENHRGAQRAIRSQCADENHAILWFVLR